MAKFLLIGLGIACSAMLLYGCSDKIQESDQNEENYTLDPKLSFGLKEKINNLTGTTPKQIIADNKKVDLKSVNWDQNQDKVNNLFSNGEITEQIEEFPNIDKAVQIIYDDITFIVQQDEFSKFYAVSGNDIVAIEGNLERDIKGILDWLNK